MKREQFGRAVVMFALAIAVIAIGVLLFGGGSSHVIHAEFTDAGQLVNGDLVTVAGHQVGQVGAIKLTPNGLADIELDLNGDVWPIHQGTRAEVRQLSLTGVANRFVGLNLSDTGPQIPDGGTIGVQSTRGIVDLDVLLDALKPTVRHSLQQIFKTGAYTFSGATPRQANNAFRYLNPALSQTNALGREVVADRFALERLISSTADVSTALAARSADLGGSVSSTAAWLRQVSAERSALGDQLVRAPAVLAQSRGVLADVSYTLGVLNPVLTHLQPVAPKLATLLRVLRPAARGAVPTITGVQKLVSPAEKALRSFTSVEPKATPAVDSLSTALTAITPVLSGLRPYVPDQVAGFFEGVAGNAGPYYDANGHFARIAPVISGTSTSLTGLLGLLGGLTSALPVLNGTQTGMLSACPGGGGPPSSDATNGWATPDALPSAGTICNPAQNQK
jgi:phospholipid/cholesterol/gamma-HCH transport system substrate-binding protein